MGTSICTYGLYCDTLSPTLPFCLIFSYSIPPVPLYPVSILLLPPRTRTRSLPRHITSHPPPVDPKNSVPLLPPPLGDPESWPPLRLQEKVHNRSRWNVLRDLILAPGDIGINFLQDYRLRSLLQKGVFPGPILPELWLFPQYLPCHPVVESPQQLPNVRGHEPSFCTE